MNVYKKVADLRMAVAVTKDGKNNFGKYNYYQIDSIYSAIKPVMKELGLVTSVNQEYCNENTTRMVLKVICVEDGSHMEYSAIIKHQLLKGMVEQQASGSDITYGAKYVHGLMLQMDDGQTDPDKNNTHGKKATTKSKLTKDNIKEMFDCLPEDKRATILNSYKVSEFKFMKMEQANDLANKMKWDR